jgi:hypothetical protein
LIFLNLAPGLFASKVPHQDIVSEGDLLQGILLRHVVFDGVREDKPARDVVRSIPHAEKVPARKERDAAPSPPR